MTSRPWSRVAVRVALGVVVAAGCAIVWLAASTTTYTASTSVYIGSQANDAAATRQRGLYDLNRAQNYAALARTNVVLDEAARRAGGTASADDLADALSVQVLPQTVVLELTIEDPSPAQAQALSTTVAAVLVEEANRIEGVGSQGSSPVHLEVLDPAVRPRSPASPDRPRIIVFSLLLGALVALVVPLSRRAGLRGSSRPVA